MSHEVETMFTVGAEPWHGLGVRLENPPTVADAIHRAGLNWPVEKVPLCRLDRAHLIGSTAETDAIVPSYATVRTDTGAYLGTVGPQWTPLQNVRAFEWFQPFIDSGDCSLEAAGSLREGKHVWVLAKINRDPVEVTSGDGVLAYLLLSNAHDGSRVARCGFTPVRVVCQNTLSAAHAGDASKLLRIRHTANIESALIEVRDTIDLVHRGFQASIDQMRSLARKGCNVDDLRKYVHRVFRTKDADMLETDSETALKSDRLFTAIEPMFLKGRGNKGETYWDAFNAVTEYLTWERGRTADNRMHSLWLGEAGALADRAMSEALKLVAA